MKKQFTITLILFPILLFAQWPTDPLIGQRLSYSHERSERIKAICPDGENGYYFCVESNGRLYINHIDHQGYLRWPAEFPSEDYHADHSDGWTAAGPRRGGMRMACNGNGEVWIAWADFRDSYWDDEYWPTSEDIYIQKFDTNRIPQWNPTTALLVQENVDPRAEYWVTDYRTVYHLEPQDNGDLILIWGDQYQAFDDNHYYGNEWAQRFDPDGNTLWDTPGIRTIPDHDWYDYSHKSPYYLSDGVGGVMFVHLNKLLRLLPAGELAWDYGDVSIDRIIAAQDACLGFDNTLTVIGYGTPQNGERDYSFATVVDTSGNFIYGPTSIGNYEDFLTAYYVNSCNDETYGVISSNETELMYYKLNVDLSENMNHVVYDPEPFINAYHQHYLISHYGIRICSNRFTSTDQDTDKEIWGWDECGDYVFTTGLNEEPADVDHVNFNVDGSGNTWVFWTVYDNDIDIYANVISPEGTWGIPVNLIDTPGVSTSLPSEISLHVYPNPGNGQFNVSFDLVDPSPAKFIVTNVLGQRIWMYDFSETRVGSDKPNLASTRATQGYLSLDLKDQASGTYFLQLRTESGQIQQRKILLLK